MEVEKYKRHFRLMAEGKLKPNMHGNYIIEKSQKGGASSQPSINFVTPVAQAVELAKSELQEDEKSYKGRDLPQNKKVYKGKKPAKKTTKRKSNSKSIKKPRVQDHVWPD